MKIYFVLILYIFSSFFLSCFAKTSEVDKIIAIVNNNPILESDVNQVLFYLKQEKNIITIPLKINFLRDKILEKLILDTLILEEAKRNNIVVSDNEVETILKKIAYKKNIPFDQFKKNIILNNTNYFFNYKNYIKSIKDALKIKIIKDYVLNNVHVSKKEIYSSLIQKIKKKNESKKINLQFIILPFSNKENDKIIKNKTILINHLFQIINHYSNFDHFYKKFKNNQNIFLTEHILSKSLIDLKNIFFNPLDIYKKNQILGPILGEKGFYIIKVNNIKNNNIDKKTNEFHIKHFLIRPSVTLDNQQAKKNIFEIYNHIRRNHYSFEYAINNLTQDVYFPFEKNDLGWIEKKSFNGIFEKVLTNLNIGEISIPIKSNIGWHIIKLIEKRKIDVKWKLEKEKIYQILLKNKMQIVKDNWMRTLKKSAYIDIFQY